MYLIIAYQRRSYLKFTAEVFFYEYIDDPTSLCYNYFFSFHLSISTKPCIPS